MKYFSSDSRMLFFTRDYRQCLCHVTFQHQMAGLPARADWWPPSEAVRLDTGLLTCNLTVLPTTGILYTTQLGRNTCVVNTGAEDILS